MTFQLSNITRMRFVPHMVGLLVVAGMLFSCKTEEDPFDRDLGHNYLALEMGKFIEYEVDSTIYDPTGDSLISYHHWYMRDVIVDTLHDNIGNVLFKTERFVRQDSLQSWQIQKVYTQSIQGNQGIVTIDNLRFIKLAFPILDFNSWNPLVHIDPDLQEIVAGETIEPFLQDGIWRSRILSSDLPMSLGPFSFEEVLTLREVNTSSYDLDTIQIAPEKMRTEEGESPIELRISFERYAKGVGLVMRERWILDSNKCQEDCNPLEINYINCYQPCFDNCINSGTDSLQCDTQCRLVDCVNEYQLFIDCQENCAELPWIKKATKGYIMRMTAIRHN